LILYSLVFWEALVLFLVVAMPSHSKKENKRPLPVIDLGELLGYSNARLKSSNDTEKDTAYPRENSSKKQEEKEVKDVTAMQASLENMTSSTTRGMSDQAKIDLQAWIEKRNNGIPSYGSLRDEEKKALEVITKEPPKKIRNRLNYLHDESKDNKPPRHNPFTVEHQKKIKAARKKWKETIGSKPENVGKDVTEWDGFTKWCRKVVEEIGGDFEKTRQWFYRQKRKDQREAQRSIVALPAARGDSVDQSLPPSPPSPTSQHLQDIVGGCN
jgi:hypothetical protein